MSSTVSYEFAGQIADQTPVLNAVIAPEEIAPAVDMDARASGIAEVITMIHEANRLAGLSKVATSPRVRAQLRNNPESVSENSAVNSRELMSNARTRFLAACGYTALDESGVFPDDEVSLLITSDWHKFRTYHGGK